MNAKAEFIKATEGFTVKCAQIDMYNGGILLNVGYNESDYKKFLNELDFDYDDGFGSQYVFGTIWLQSEAWFIRGEYDGSEWWKYQKAPAIPDTLK